MPNFYAEISKVDNDQRLVWGYASTEALDHHMEIIKREAIAEALSDYMQFGNIREMHQPSAVGVAKSATLDDKGMLLCAHVVDDTAWEKVKAGVYKGFSVGGRALVKVGGIISKMRLMEISLVDRPANPECVFTMYKGEDTMQCPAYMNKGMYNVIELARIIESLSWLRASCLGEAEWEGDDKDRAQAATINTHVMGLLDILGAMVVEEGAELTAADIIDDIAKTEDNDMNAKHDAAVEKGDKSECNDDCGCSEKGDIVNSAAASDSNVIVKAMVDEAVADALVKLDLVKTAHADEIKKLQDELDTLKGAEPMPVKGVVTAGAVVTKADDTIEGDHITSLDAAFVPFQKAMLAGDATGATFEHIKLIHKMAPRRIM